MSLILKDGIYHINHAYVPVRIALAGHSSEDGTPVIAWSIMDDCLDHLWLIHAVPGEDVTYTIQNAVSGTYMDMRGSSAADGTLVIGFQKRTPGENQKWIIRPEASGSGHWK
ncbi:carbohydrate-binding module family 13 protein [Trametes sanguinea]|nr:carbohydrate-binding module family 13 protein [Trametes sanguinea]